MGLHSNLNIRSIVLQILKLYSIPFKSKNIKHIKYIPANVNPIGVWPNCDFNPDLICEIIA